MLRYESRLSADQEIGENCFALTVLIGLTMGGSVSSDFGLT